jgi:hypothetical protein
MNIFDILEFHIVKDNYLKAEGLQVYELKSK